MNPTVECPKCRAPLLGNNFARLDFFNQPELTPCPGCATPVRVEIFPACFRKAAPGPSAEVILVEGESSCFFHPQKRAVRPCDNCGRFVCALCDCELQGRHLCPACLETGKAKGKIKNLDNRRTLYENIALSLALYPMLIFYFTLITAPVTLFIALRYWKSPPSMVRGNKIRFSAAIVIALLQLAGWAALFIFLWTRKHQPPLNHGQI